MKDMQPPMKEMPPSSEREPDRYEGFFRDFELPLMQEIRRQVYGEDIGLHSWGSVQELRADRDRLHLSPSSSLADLGCGTCGALTDILAAVDCRGTGVGAVLEVHVADLDGPLPLESSSFDVILSIDTIPHLRDRRFLFQEVARLLHPGGHFLCIDPCVLTGAVSNHDLQHRLTWGYTQLAAPGYNERLLEESGLQLIECEDRTAGACENAERKAVVYAAHRDELERQAEWFEGDRHQLYLETAARLARERRMARMMYLAVRPSDDHAIHDARTCLPLR